VVWWCLEGWLERMEGRAKEALGFRLRELFVVGCHSVVCPIQYERRIMQVLPNEVGFVASLYCHLIFDLFMANTSQDLDFVPHPNSVFSL